MKMHSKLLGTSGELLVAHEFYKRGISCFIEPGDLSRIDLIAQATSGLIRIQVKTLTRSSDGSYKFDSRKRTRGYEYWYAQNDVDIFAVYCVEDNCIAWIKSCELIISEGCNFMSLRSIPTKNNQNKKVNWLKDYIDINRIL